MKKARRFIRYASPGSRKSCRIPISGRELELVVALRKAGPCSRVDLLRNNNWRLGLNAPATVSQLRAKGLHISAEWQTAADADGVPTRFVRYALRGRVLGMEVA